MGTYAAEFHTKKAVAAHYEINIFNRPHSMFYASI